MKCKNCGNRITTEIKRRVSGGYVHDVCPLEMNQDTNRVDWLLKNSCIKVNNLYYTSRESLDEAIRAAEPAND